MLLAHCISFMEDAIAKTPITGGTIKQDNEIEIKELRETIEMLKTQIKDMHSRLLEAAVLNNKYIQAVQDYQKQIEQLKKPPLFICSVVELFDDMALLRQHGSNQEIVTKVPDEMMKEIEAVRALQSRATLPSSGYYQNHLMSGRA